MVNPTTISMTQPTEKGVAPQPLLDVDAEQQLIRLFVYEVQRVFSDRLVNSADQQLFQN